MDRKLEEELFKKHPQLFQDKNKPPTESLICFGIETGNGWYNLLNKLCEDIMKTNPDPNFRFIQIKEKYGGLRAYPLGAASEEVWNIIDAAEKRSYIVCETCGATPSKQYDAGWIYNMCDDCWRKFAKKRDIYVWRVLSNKEEEESE